MERRHFTLQDKLEILEYARTHSKKQTASNFNIQTKQIRDWESKEQEMRAIPENLRSKPLALHPVKSEEAETPFRLAL